MSAAYQCDRCKRVLRGIPWTVLGTVLCHKTTLQKQQDICDACKEDFHKWLQGPQP